MKSSADEQTSEKNVNGGIASGSSCVLVPAEPSEVQHDAEGGENEESKVAPNSVLKSGETADLDHSNHVNEKGQTSEGSSNGMATNDGFTAQNDFGKPVTDFPQSAPETSKNASANTNGGVKEENAIAENASKENIQRNEENSEKKESSDVPKETSNDFATATGSDTFGNAVISDNGKYENAVPTDIIDERNKGISEDDIVSKSERTLEDKNTSGEINKHPPDNNVTTTEIPINGGTTMESGDKENKSLVSVDHKAKETCEQKEDNSGTGSEEGVSSDQSNVASSDGAGASDQKNLDKDDGSYTKLGNVGGKDEKVPGHGEDAKAHDVLSNIASEEVKFVQDLESVMEDDGRNRAENVVVSSKGEHTDKVENDAKIDGNVTNEEGNRSTEKDVAVNVENGASMKEMAAGDSRVVSDEEERVDNSEKVGSDGGGEATEEENVDTGGGKLADDDGNAAEKDGNIVTNGEIVSSEDDRNGDSHRDSASRPVVSESENAVPGSIKIESENLPRKEMVSQGPTLTEATETVLSEKEIESQIGTEGDETKSELLKEEERKELDISKDVDTTSSHVGAETQKENTAGEEVVKETEIVKLSEDKTTKDGAVDEPETRNATEGTEAELEKDNAELEGAGSSCFTEETTSDRQDNNAGTEARKEASSIEDKTAENIQPESVDGPSTSKEISSETKDTEESKISLDVVVDVNVTESGDKSNEESNVESRSGDALAEETQGKLGESRTLIEGACTEESYGKKTGSETEVVVGEGNEELEIEEKTSSEEDSARKEDSDASTGNKDGMTAGKDSSGETTAVDVNAKDAETGEIIKTEDRKDDVNIPQDQPSVPDPDQPTEPAGKSAEESSESAKDEGQSTESATIEGRNESTILVDADVSLEGKQNKDEASETTKKNDSTTEVAHKNEVIVPDTISEAKTTEGDTDVETAVETKDQIGDPDVGTVVEPEDQSGEVNLEEAKEAEDHSGDYDTITTVGSMDEINNANVETAAKTKGETSEVDGVTTGETEDHSGDLDSRKAVGSKNEINDADVQTAIETEGQTSKVDGATTGETEDHSGYVVVATTVGSRDKSDYADAGTAEEPKVQSGDADVETAVETMNQSDSVDITKRDKAEDQITEEKKVVEAKDQNTEVDVGTAEETKDQISDNDVGTKVETEDQSCDANEMTAPEAEHQSGEVDEETPEKPEDKRSDNDIRTVVEPKDQISDNDVGTTVETEDQSCGTNETTALEAEHQSGEVGEETPEKPEDKRSDNDIRTAVEPKDQISDNDVGTTMETEDQSCGTNETTAHEAGHQSGEVGEETPEKPEDKRSDNDIRTAVEPKDQSGVAGVGMTVETEGQIGDNDATAAVEVKDQSDATDVVKTVETVDRSDDVDVETVLETKDKSGDSDVVAAVKSVDHIGHAVVVTTAKTKDEIGEADVVTAVDTKDQTGDVDVGTTVKAEDDDEGTPVETKDQIRDNEVVTAEEAKDQSDAVHEVKTNETNDQSEAVDMVKTDEIEGQIGETDMVAALEAKDQIGDVEEGIEVETEDQIGAIEQETAMETKDQSGDADVGTEGEVKDDIGETDVVTAVETRDQIGHADVGTEGEVKDEIGETDVVTAVETKDEIGHADVGTEEEVKDDIGKTDVVTAVETKDQISVTNLGTEEEAQDDIGETDVVTAVETKDQIGDADLGTEEEVKDDIVETDVVTAVETKDQISDANLGTEGEVKDDVGKTDVVTAVETKDQIGDADLGTEEEVKDDVGETDVVTAVETKDQISVTNIGTEEEAQDDIGETDVVTAVETKDQISHADVETEEEVKHDIGETDMVTAMETKDQTGDIDVGTAVETKDQIGNVDGMTAVETMNQNDSADIVKTVETKDQNGDVNVETVVVATDQSGDADMRTAVAVEDKENTVEGSGTMNDVTSASVIRTDEEPAEHGLIITDKDGQDLPAAELKSETLDETCNEDKTSPETIVKESKHVEKEISSETSKPDEITGEDVEKRMFGTEQEFDCRSSIEREIKELEGVSKTASGDENAQTTYDGSQFMEETVGKDKEEVIVTEMEHVVVTSLSSEKVDPLVSDPEKVDLVATDESEHVSEVADVIKEMKEKEITPGTDQTEQVAGDDKEKPTTPCGLNEIQETVTGIDREKSSKDMEEDGASGDVAEKSTTQITATSKEIPSAMKNKEALENMRDLAVVGVSLDVKKENKTKVSESKRGVSTLQIETLAPVSKDLFGEVQPTEVSAVEERFVNEEVIDGGAVANVVDDGKKEDVLKLSEDEEERGVLGENIPAEVSEEFSPDKLLDAVQEVDGYIWVEHLAIEPKPNEDTEDVCWDATIDKADLHNIEDGYETDFDESEGEFETPGTIISDGDITGMKQAVEEVDKDTKFEKEKEEPIALGDDDAKKASEPEVVEISLEFLELLEEFCMAVTQEFPSDLVDFAYRYFTRISKKRKEFKKHSIEISDEILFSEIDWNGAI